MLIICVLLFCVKDFWKQYKTTPCGNRYEQGLKGGRVPVAKKEKMWYNRHMAKEVCVCPRRKSLLHLSSGLIRH